MWNRIKEERLKLGLKGDSCSLAGRGICSAEVKVVKHRRSCYSKSLSTTLRKGGLYDEPPDNNSEQERFFTSQYPFGVLRKTIIYTSAQVTLMQYH